MKRNVSSSIDWRIYILVISLICCGGAYVIKCKCAESNEDELKRILNLLAYAKKDSVYSAKNFVAGYNTLILGKVQLEGQRIPQRRLLRVPYDFVGKTVLDIGTNQGGMLLAISDKIKHGVGVDFDHKLINVANKLKSYLGLKNVDFYVFDLEKERLEFTSNFLPERGVDFCFLLSVCIWIKNWKRVIDYAYEISEVLLFESNGSRKQQVAQVAYLKGKYHRILLLNSKSEDDVFQPNRMLFICYKHEII